MERAFWDSSSLVPLCVRQSATPKAQSVDVKDPKAVWCRAPIEMQGAFARLLRIGQLTTSGQVQAQVRLDHLRRDWQEVEPSEELRERAEELVDRFPLKAADAFQLAAAWKWCLGRPRSRAFICGDAQLLSAARQLGFQGIEA
jgi:predicted nucleic acid-binding protein